MIIDFHTHTYHSYDCLMKPAKILRIAKDRGLNGIVINDHNTIKGGLETAAANNDPGFTVIIGAEIATNAGDITGLFLKEEITSRDTAEVLSQIKAQGGISILNHPFLGHKLDEINFNGIDIIEGFNSRLTYDQNLRALELAKGLKKPVIAGSDAHLYSEIANCKTVYDQSDLSHKALFKPVSLLYTFSHPVHYLKSQSIKAWKNRDLVLMMRIIAGSPRQLRRKSHYKQYKLDLNEKA